MNFLQNLNLRNLFSGNDPQPQVGFPINTTGLFDPPDYEPTNNRPEPIVTNPLNPPDSNLTALRGRARPYMDQYAELLKSQPNRQDYQLSKVGKALAAASGILSANTKGAAHGIDVFRGLAEEPYNRAQQDYATKTGRTKELAGVEDARIKDEEKLELAIAADEAKKRDDLRQMIQTESNVRLGDARIKEIQDKIKNGGLSWSVNNITGRRELLDTKTGQIVPFDKINETPTEKDAREFVDFKKRFGVEQAGKIQIKGMDEAHDKVMEGIKNKNALALLGQRQAGDESLVKLKNNLDKLSPSQRGAAFDNAYKQVLMMNPEMRDILFTSDADGNPTLKKDYNKDAFNLFTGSVQELMRQNMGEPSSGFQGAVPNTDPTMGPRGNVPGGMPPSDTSAIDPARQAQAVAWLRTNGYESDPASIAEWIRQDDAANVAQPQVPQVQIPPQVTPDIGLEAIKRLPGQIGSQFQFGNIPRPAPNVQLTNPNMDVGLNSIGGLINSIRNTPERIYGPQSRRVPGR